MLLLPASANSAEELKTIFQQKWTGIVSGTSENEVAAMIRSVIDPEGEGAKFTLDFHVHENKVVTRVTLSEEKAAEAQGIQEMIASMAGHIFGHDQSIHLELDIGHDINTILHSQNKIVDALNSARFNFLFLGVSSLFRDLQSIVEATEARTLHSVAEPTGAHQLAVHALSYLDLYQSAVLNIKLKSAADLPDAVKEKAARMGAKANLHEMKAQIPEPLSAFIQHLVAHGNGEVQLFASAGRLAAELKVHAPGASQFFAN